jgi:O-antigen ligase
MNNGFLKTTQNLFGPTKILIVFGALSLFALIFPIPEKIIALLFLIFFFLVTALNPINGTAFILFSLPFFLGAPHKPFFFLFDVLVYGYLIIGFSLIWKRETRIEIPFKPLIILLALSYLFSLPVNAKEYYYEFWATPFKEIWFQWLTGHEKFPFFHLRTLSNDLSGILLFILIFNLFSKKGRKDLEEIWKNSIWMAAGVCLIGFLFLFHIIPSQPKTYLSLSLSGIHEGALSAFAFNRQYLAQYLIIFFPLVLYFLFLNRKKIMQFSFYLVVAGVFLLSLSATMQRSAFLILFLEIFLLIMAYIFLFSPRKKTALFFLMIPFLLLAVMILLDFVFLNKRFLSRLAQWGLSDPDNRRLHLWAAAWNMFTYSPLLGVGLGKYYEFFPEFFNARQISWKVYGFVRGEPHSFFFQTLSEQGAIGVLLVITLISLILTYMIKKARKEPSADGKMLSVVLMVSILSWFSLGFFHNVAYVRSLGILLWILLGWAVCLVDPQTDPLKGKLYTKSFIIGLTVLSAALGYQVKLIYDRPLNPFFRTGLYDREVAAGGEKVYWTGKRAVINTKIQEDSVTLSLSAPLPEIRQHPQQVRLWVGGHSREVSLNDAQWHQIVIPIDDQSAGRILLKIEVSHTHNPQKDKFGKDDRDLGVLIGGID